jgi:lipoprotein NlpI
MGDLDSAIEDLNKAIALKPNEAYGYDSRANARSRKGDLDGALADHNRAIELDARNMNAYIDRGITKRRMGDSDGALADYNKAIDLNPNVGNAFASRGYLHYDRQAFTNALADYRKALEKGASNPDYIHYRIWLIRSRLGEMDAATKEILNYFDTRVTGKPDDWQATIGRFLAGQSSEAVLLKAAESPDRQKSKEQHCEAYFYAGSKQLLSGNKTVAKDYFKECLETGIRTFVEFDSARAEIDLLQDAK